MSHLSQFASKLTYVIRKIQDSVAKLMGNHGNDNEIHRQQCYDFISLASQTFDKLTGKEQGLARQTCYRIILLVVSKMKIEFVFNIASLFSTSLCCHNGGKIILIIQSNYIFLFVLDIWHYPSSTTVSLGQQATFYCDGHGSYLYWFINGVNSEDMTTEELETRGISLSGYYNYFPPYIFCDILYSLLYMAGNCLNNNTDVYCVILGHSPPPSGGNATSPTALLTVQGYVLYVLFVRYTILQVIQYLSQTSKYSQLLLTVYFYPGVFILLLMRILH